MRSTVLVSDLSGEVLQNGNAAHIIIATEAEPNVRYTLDVSTTEIENLLEKAQKTKRRGRPSKSK